MLLRRSISRLSGASLSPFGAFLLRFVRTVILSRLLEPHELGAAVALLSILAICEMITDVGLDRFVIVAHHQTPAQAVAAARQVALLRAAFLAVVIAGSAPLLGRIFGIEGRVGTIALLGVVPLITGFRNWRAAQVQREYRYGPEAIASIGGQLAAVSTIVPAVMWLHDERAVLVSLLAEAVANVVLSHLVVPAEPVARVDPAIRRSAFLFGLPLMINGVGLAAMKQFDQVVVVNRFGLSSLALYALGLNLALVPASLLQIVAQKLGLPFLGNAGADDQAARLAPLAVMLGFIGMGALCALATGGGLDLAVPLIYGRHYVVPEAFCVLAMLVVFLRLCRGGPNMLLLHQGRTRRLMLGNLSACVGLGASVLLAGWSGRIEGVVGGLVIGDAVSLAVLLALVRRELPMAIVLSHLGALTAATGLSGAAFWLAGTPSLAQRAIIVALACLAIGIEAVFIYRGVGRVVIGHARQRNSPMTQHTGRDSHAPSQTHVAAKGIAAD